MRLQIPHGVAASQVPSQRERDFDAGWRTAANWANRDDLLADMDSPAYLKDRADAVGLLASPAPEKVGPLLREIRDFLSDLGPLTAYGLPGSRDVDQARYQEALRRIQERIAALSAAGVPVREQPRHDNGEPAPEDTIAKCKRILAAVDAYHEQPTQATRSDLRHAIYAELERAAAGVKTVDRSRQ